MPRVYMRKTPKNSVEALEQAIWAYRNSSASQAVIAAQYGLPRSTLAKYLKPNQALPKRLTQGRDRVFTDEEELAMVKFAIDLAKKGCPLNREAFSKFVFSMAKSCGKENRLQSTTNGFKKERAGEQFLNSFLLRHPTLRFQSVTSSSPVCTQDLIKKFTHFSSDSLEIAKERNAFQSQKVQESSQIATQDAEMTEECHSESIL